MSEYSFDISATNSCKGVALMLLLWHHLFTNSSISIKFNALVSETAQSASVCVAIFVILSGYGLAETVKGKSVELLAFYKKRLAKLYLNYWLIAALFIPIGIIFMGRTLDSVFLDHKYLKFAIQMTGFQLFFYREYGFNSTWGYMSIIITLYILFPFFNNLTRKYGLYFLLFCLLLLFPISIRIPVIQMWILPFALGIFMSDLNGFSKTSILLNKTGRIRYGILVCLIIIVAFIKKFGFSLSRGYSIDWLYGWLIMLMTFEIINSFDKARHVLSFLGKHLFNIFLFHTFIYFYYWTNYIYFFKYPLLIFAVLLSVSLFVSMLIELLKKYISFYSLSKTIENIRIPDGLEIKI